MPLAYKQRNSECPGLLLLLVKRSSHYREAWSMNRTLCLCSANFFWQHAMVSLSKSSTQCFRDSNRLRHRLQSFRFNVADPACHVTYNIAKKHSVYVYFGHDAVQLKWERERKRDKNCKTQRLQTSHSKCDVAHGRRHNSGWTIEMIGNI